MAIRSKRKNTTAIAAVVVEVHAYPCPACRVNAGVRDILTFKRPYLENCERHVEMWDEQNLKDLKRERKRTGER